MSLGRILIGLLLVVLGVLFLLEQGGYVEDIGDVIGDWWPVALIAVGGVQLLTNPRLALGPLILVGAGAVLLLATLDVLPFSVGEMIWPLILIAAGTWFLLGRGAATLGAQEDGVNSIVVFSGREIASTSQQFRGGSVLAVFGGTDLDLREAQLDPGGAVLDVVAAFGGVDIVVPTAWRVRVSGLPIFGGWSNKPPGPVPEDAPLLAINALTIFGGMEVKYAALV